MSIQQLLVVAIVAAAVVFVVRAFWRSFKDPQGCHCSDAGKPADMGIKRTPLVQLGRREREETASTSSNVEERRSA